MKKYFIVSPIFFFLLCGHLMAGNSVIPKPFSSESSKGNFAITSRTKIIYFVKNEEMKPTLERFVQVLRASTGYDLPMLSCSEMPKKDFIFFNNIQNEMLGREGYTLEIKKDKIFMEANSDTGFFYGIQTLLQLLPPEVAVKKKPRTGRLEVQCARITDKPRFTWRGMHFDVSRHYFSKEFIKIYLDMLALHKMNVFHFHLTDDQGWRIEIRQYPKLTGVGAWRADREDKLWNDRSPQQEGEKATYGGFYTQDDIREIVQYAAERFITVVPEIEMPAHSGAALAAYPEYSCTGGPFTVPPGGVWPITTLYCAGNDGTFSFLENILGEVIELFPSQYIHIGGDEADKTEWIKCPRCQDRIKSDQLKDESELQSYFIKRIEKYLVSKERKLIGWDEILEGGLAPEATVMSWRGMDGGIAAARQNHDVVMTPGSHCYFDHYQGRQEFEPLAIGGYSPLSKVYSFEPVPDSLTPEQAGHVLGAQANVWTEYISTPEHAQYMTLPRMAAMAEAVWSPKEARNWDDFSLRVEPLMKRYELLNYNYAKSIYLVSIVPQIDPLRKRATISLKTELNAPQIRYTLNGNNPSAGSSRYKKPFDISKTTVIRAGAYRGNKLLGNISEQKVFLHKAFFKPVTLKIPFNKYTGGGDFALTNGVRGTKSYDDGNWQGFEQNDLEATIDLGKPTAFSKIMSSFLQNTNSWIFFPVQIEYSVSEDGINFTSVRVFKEPAAAGHQDVTIKEFIHGPEKMKARFIRVSAKNVGVCPDWHIGKGGKAWIFIDEIVLE